MSKPTKPFEDHFHIRGEWVLFRRVFKKSSVLRITEEQQKSEDMEAVVISHGPGEWQNGVFVPVEGLPAGTLIVVPGDHCKTTKRWLEKSLFVCPASSIISTMDPMDDLDMAPVIIIPKKQLVS